MNYFYEPKLEPNIKEILLNEQESHHATKVLRLNKGAQVLLTNGRGYLFKGNLEDTGKKHCTLTIREHQQIPPAPYLVHLAVSSLKNRNRMEWMLEKATELGVNHFTFLHCAHTERDRIREDRMEKVVISAVKQSLKAYKPQIAGPVPFRKFLQNLPALPGKFIAHCQTGKEKFLLTQYDKGRDVICLIGPEGDFSRKEIEEAESHSFQSVSLGNSRLRSETAALTALIMFHTQNQL